MNNENFNIVLSFGLLLAVILYILRLIAIKIGKDPIMGRYKPGTPTYLAYQKLLKPRRFISAMVISILIALSLGAIVVSNSLVTLRMSPVPWYVFATDLAAGAAVFLLALAVGYYLLVKS